MQPYSSNDMATAWKHSCFILSKRLDLYMIDKQSIAVYAFPMRTLTSLSEDKILLPRYVSWSINFRVLLYDVEMGPFSKAWNNPNFILLAITSR